MCEGEVRKLLKIPAEQLLLVLHTRTGEEQERR